MRQRRAIVVKGGEPLRRIRQVQLWPHEGDEEPEHQQEAQEAGVYRRAQPAGEQVAQGRRQQSKRNHESEAAAILPPSSARPLAAEASTVNTRVSTAMMTVAVVTAPKRASKTIKRG